jgi:23S rRNA pseudouridine1911/1915/1917 synthase
MQSPFGLATRAAECERLDLAMTREPFSLSRREAKRVINAHRVSMNGKIVSVESRRVASGTRLCLLASDVSVPILDEYDELVVIDKPPLVPTQPSPDDPNPSLIEIVASMLKRRGDKEVETFVVHRLDTNTTGVVLVARSQRAAMLYSKLVTAEKTEKRYVALVEGCISEPMTIDAPIGRVKGNLFGIVETGKAARSIVTPISANERASRVEVQIESGRTHQIRIHLAHAGHPVIGDLKYGSGSTTVGARRPMLHSHSLRLDDKIWTAPVPPDFEEISDRLELRATN